jgi:hypothetical protein
MAAGSGAMTVPNSKMADFPVLAISSAVWNFRELFEAFGKI